MGKNEAPTLNVHETGAILVTARSAKSQVLNGLLADVFTLYLKTKNFHWHMSGPHFRDYHLLLDEHADQFVTPTDMLVELRADNQHLSRSLHSAHATCEEHDDVATASLIETWIDQTERRTWFLSETVRDL